MASISKEKSDSEAMTDRLVPNIWYHEHFLHPISEVIKQIDLPLKGSVRSIPEF